MTINGLDCKIIEKGSKKSLIEIDGQKIQILSEYIPQSLEAGKTLKIYFVDSFETIGSEKKLAKVILEEILNGK